jgi:NADH-quinone oxidoreductase subunit N
MEMLRLHFADLKHLTPELTIVITMLLLTIVDLLLPRRQSRTIIGVIGLIGIAVSAVLVALKIGDEPISLIANSYRVDDFGNLFKLLFLGGTGLIFFSSFGTIKEEEVPHLGELYYLLLPALLGSMVMVSSGDLITMFIGLELLSITTYILVAMRKKNVQSTEGAFKYVVLGSIASAFILYGISFIYGMTGTTNLSGMSAVLYQNYESYGTLIYLSFFLILAGLGFKIAAAPFHQWAPDVYQGAPLPVTSFLAVVSKGAAIAMLFRLVYMLYYGLGSEDLPFTEDMFLVLSILGATAMIMGNFLALRQRNLKRLFAYSGVANAGYLLVPIAEQLTNFHVNNMPELYYYLVAYFLMNIGAFVVISVVTNASGHEEMSSFEGLYHRAPWTASAMLVLVLSLAGLPITGGFFGKFFILLGAVHNQLYWLAVIMIVTSIASYFYYFAIAKQMFMRSSEIDAPIKITIPQSITIWLCAGLSVVMGLFPQWLLGWVNDNFSLVTDFFF